MNSQNTSFIPQRPTQGKINNRSVRKIYILSYVSYVVFFGTVFAAIAVILYTLSLHNQVNAQKQKLTQEKSQFGQGDIESILQLESLIATAKQKMDAHISIPRIFTALENSTLEALQIKEFSYKRENDNPPEILLTASASNFNDVLFQNEVLKANPILKSASFSKIILTTLLPTDTEFKPTSSNEEDPIPSIDFEIGINVDPALVNYEPPQVVSTSSASTTSSGSSADSLPTNDFGAGVTGDSQ